jgi:integrase
LVPENALMLRVCGQLRQRPGAALEGTRETVSSVCSSHAFRHTYTTLLTQNNEEVKVVQELLRHANSRITLDLYAQAGMPNKRLAQSKLVRMVLNEGEALA